MTSEYAQALKETGLWFNWQGPCFIASNPSASHLQTQFLQWNVRRLLRKLSELKQLVSANFPTAICITETHLHPSQNLRLASYHVYRRDRLDGYGGR